MRGTEKKIKQANWGRDARLEGEKRSREKRWGEKKKMGSFST